MPFTAVEREALLAVKGVGPTVIQRLEEIGIHSFDELIQYQPRDIAELVSSMLHSSCWKNSPRALASIEAAINRAKQGR